MVQREEELDCLLALIEEHVDIDHLRSSDERQLRALTWEEVDRPPLVVQHRWGEETPFGEAFRLPSPWDTFARYSYDETFDSPAAMLQNMLLDFVVPGILLKDDSPLAIRNNHGFIQISSVLGCSWRRIEGNYPFVEPFDSVDRIREIDASEEEPARSAGVLERSFETLKFYHEKLREHPGAYDAIQISLPDLQGPFDTAEQCWGSGIYISPYEEPELLMSLQAKIVDTMLTVSEWYREFSTDRLDPQANTQHGYVIPGRILIRDVGALSLSPAMYTDFIMPHNARLLKEVGGGALNFCGDARHLVQAKLATPRLLGLDLGDGQEEMDRQALYVRGREAGVAITNLQPSREELVSGAAAKDYPSGCAFVYETSDFEDAAEVVSAYSASAGN